MVSAKASPIAVWSVDESARSRVRVGIPRVEVHIGVRYGSSARNGLDVHAMGARRRVYRKTILGGQRAIFARLPIGAYRAALGAPPASIVGHTVELSDLWGPSEAARLVDRLARARDEEDSGAGILREAIAERVELGGGPSGHTGLVAAATEMLELASVAMVAEQLGLSERHFRRVFRDTMGVSPKTYARLRRFQRALAAGRGADEPDWSKIALEAGYYDQAHLIADFRSIGGATPRVLVAELRAAL
ncbi:helix-turn-helix transcriptional regulator [Pseudenhygromyxa sp. WMMC2535]|uniref:helix-turn-helix domain-containing protein n=1 Tax=Pseudenhygromyxa sp. WMMC2535 TaxID=2712867 RepID=UPI00159590ED|nr:helix-turn-helix transcriptional regulator [Pseudenhygromyxa sp. WMMC2535]NVB39599.1 helix-turn-helix transcriptional regulator [Pseudenhygromyxa sp. WMMC2535]